VVATGGYAVDFSHMVLPVAVLSVLPFAHTAQVMRAGVIAQSRMSYILTAHAKGVRDRDVAFRHVLPNAAIPVMTLAIYDLSIIIFSSATVEVVFAWPGIGRLTFDALSRGDVFLVEAVIVLGAVVIVGLNICADLLAFRLDPRTRSVIEEPSR
jgi:peptide/nickel transport system permease protein